MVARGALVVSEESKGVDLYVEVISPVNRIRDCCSSMVKDAGKCKPILDASKQLKNYLHRHWEAVEVT